MKMVQGAARMLFAALIASLLLTACGRDESELADSPVPGPSGTGSTATYA